MFQSIRIPAGIRSHLRWLIFFSVATNFLALAVPLHILQVYGRVLKSGSLPTLFYLSAIVITMLLVAAVADYSRRRVARRLANKYLMEIHPDIVRGLAYETDKSVRSSRVISDARSVAGFLASRNFIGLFDMPFSMLFLLALYALSFWLGLVATLGLGAMLALAMFNNRSTSNLQNRTEKMESDAFGFATATLRDTDEIRAMGLAEPIRERWKLKLLAAFEANDESSGKAAGFSVAGSFIRQATQVLMVSVGAMLVLSGEMHGGIVFAATFITNRLLTPVSRTIGSWTSITRSFRTHLKLTDLTAVIASDNGRTAIDRPAGRVEVDQVFLAPDAKQPTRFLLTGLSLDLEPGRITVITGGTGSGKSSLARIVAGAASPDSGHVKLDGTTRDDWRAEDWGRAVGYVAQTIKLSPVSVSENITRLNYDFDSERLLKASRAARAHGMISNLPKGYATVLERGEVFLTDRQTMKIALARALYGDPSVLVLDEPDTDLDRSDQKELIEILTSLRDQGVAILVISRRSQMRAVADDVYELKTGTLSRVGGRRKRDKEDRTEADAPAAESAPVRERRHAVSGSANESGGTTGFRPSARSGDLDDIRASIDRIFARHRQVV
ncbi:ATP-binding cassette domain-containing protein [Zhengella mangrovi]|uniref:ATP-binding cassette domain-containing protein n=1 Tax=Zhengella mangrovi TaxID=1982044 RepID=UPI0013FDC0F7|nr:ATP-binding cassette domain-containing protein [Zhengella mangrovi]